MMFDWEKYLSEHNIDTSADFTISNVNTGNGYLLIYAIENGIDVSGCLEYFSDTVVFYSLILFTACDMVMGTCHTREIKEFRKQNPEADDEILALSEEIFTLENLWANETLFSFFLDIFNPYVTPYVLPFTVANVILDDKYLPEKVDEQGEISSRVAQHLYEYCTQTAETLNNDEDNDGECEIVVDSSAEDIVNDGKEMIRYRISYKICFEGYDVSGEWGIDVPPVEKNI